MNLQKENGHGCGEPLNCLANVSLSHVFATHAGQQQQTARLTRGHAAKPPIWPDAGEHLRKRADARCLIWFVNVHITYDDVTLPRIEFAATAAAIVIGFLA